MIDKETLKEKLKELGVKENMVLEVHSSLSSMGYVDGGAMTVIEALKELVTEEGSIFMPALRISKEYELSTRDKELGITAKIKILPPDNKKSAMGVIADTFLTLNETVVGDGIYRIAGWGKHKNETVTSGLNYAINNGGYALLIGVDIYRLTSMHYVENYLPQGIVDFFTPNELARREYSSDEWIIETSKPPVKAWYKIQELAYQKNLIKETMIGDSKVMFFKINDVVSLYKEALISHPYELYGLK